MVIQASRKSLNSDSLYLFVCLFVCSNCLLICLFFCLFVLLCRLCVFYLFQCLLVWWRALSYCLALSFSCFVCLCVCVCFVFSGDFLTPIYMGFSSLSRPPKPRRIRIGMEGFPCRKSQKSQAPIKLAQPFLAPELRAKTFYGHSASAKVSHKRVFTLIRRQPGSANTGF